MTRRLVSVLCLLALPALASAAPKRSLTLEDIFGPDADWDGVSLQSLQWEADGSAFLYVDADPDGETKNIYRENVDDGERTVVVDGKSLVLGPGRAPIPFTDYQASEDGLFFVLAGPRSQADFRGSPPPDRSYYLYDTVTRALRPLSGIAGAQQYAKLAPDGTRIGFVRGGNLFVVDRASGTETQLTFDGNDDILNGVNKGLGADGWRWSPDGKRILFVRVDQSAVGTVPLIDFLTPYPKVHRKKYPKAGDTNWKLRVGVLHLESGQTSWLQLGPDTDVYFPRLNWTRNPAVVAVQRLNRQQNKLELLFADVTTGASRAILTETDPYWVRIDNDLTFLTNSDRFIWTSQRSGYKHAYLYDYDGSLLNQITSGEWEINAARSRHAVLGVDEADGWLYFGGKKDGVIEQHVYRVRLDGQELQRLSRKPGWHAASVSPDANHFVNTFSDVNTPPQISMHRSDGGLVRWVRRGEMPGLADFELVKPEFLTVRTSDGVDLNAVMIKPAGFNLKEKYPVIFYAYGGVSSQTVVNRWGGDLASWFPSRARRWLWHQLMTQKGYIVFTIDNRGTGGRGKAFENFMYQNLGTWPLRDHIEGAKYLARLPYTDPSRIGIWGRSAGGYLTSLALTEGSDYFTVGVSQAPVTNYLSHSSSWVERYMGLPKENMAAYDKEAVVTYAPKLKGHLLLVHGIADDNVHLQNTLEVAEAFQAANKQFDLMLYHGRNHSLRGGNTQLHLFTLMTEYFLRHLPPSVPEM